MKDHDQHETTRRLCSARHLGFWVHRLELHDPRSASSSSSTSFVSYSASSLSGLWTVRSKTSQTNRINERRAKGPHRWRRSLLRARPRWSTTSACTQDSEETSSTNTTGGGGPILGPPELPLPGQGLHTIAQQPLCAQQGPEDSSWDSHGPTGGQVLRRGQGRV